MEGPRCDQCRLGTFSLDASNPKGCTKCFCFGATDRCRSAEKHRAEVRRARGHQSLRFSCAPVRPAPRCPRALSCVNPTPLEDTWWGGVSLSPCARLPHSTPFPGLWGLAGWKVTAWGGCARREAGVAGSFPVGCMCGCEPVVVLPATLGLAFLEHQHPDAFWSFTRRPAVALPPQFIDMTGWLLLSSDRQEVPTTLSLPEQLLRADLKNLLDAYQELYWVAPSSYLGDQVRARWQLDQRLCTSLTPLACVPAACPLTWRHCSHSG